MSPSVCNWKPTKTLSADVTFIDFKKAFDSTTKGQMFKILQTYDIPSRLVTAIELIHRWELRRLSNQGRGSTGRHISAVSLLHCAWLCNEKGQSRAGIRPWFYDHARGVPVGYLLSIWHSWIMQMTLLCCQTPFPKRKSYLIWWKWSVVTLDWCSMIGRRRSYPVTWKVNQLCAVDKVKSWRTFLTLNTSVHDPTPPKRILKSGSA